jgi:amino acid adenylation domain-containing protein
MKFTLPQQDVYFDQLLHPNKPIYNIGAKIEINGTLNISIFKKSYEALIAQHDAYRTIFTRSGETVAIKLEEGHHSKLGFIDFSDSKKPHLEANKYMEKEFLKPFDLFSGNLLHVFTLIKVGEDLHYLFSVYHHIITDGWGTSLMFQRLVQNYNEIFDFGSVQTLYPFSYKDFMKDDEEYQKSVFIEEDKNYWKDKFSTLPENLFDKIDDSIQITKSKHKELFINRKVYNQLNELAVQYKCSTFHLILAVLYTYFGRKQQNNNFAIGLPVLNRSKSKYKKTVGLFMGISPLRMSINFEEKFETLIKDIKDQLKKDYRHQRFPLGKLIQELQLFNEKERLFNITLSYEKQDYAINFKHTQTKVIPLSHQSERVALAIYIREYDEFEDVKVDFDYNLNYFDDLRITEVVCHFEKLISSILAFPDKKLKELIYLTEEEEHHILVEFNNTKVDYPKEKTVVDLFKVHVEKAPEKVALKDDFKSYSYSELNKISNQIAEYLIATYGEQDKSPIGVLLGRSAEMVVVLLAILKSGRAYIPLDPTFPKERLNYIVGDSQIKLIIKEGNFELKEVEDVSLLSLENILTIIVDFKGILTETISSKDTAYIIYTSGSTGNPKGVEIIHKALLNFLCSIKQKPGISTDDILFSVTTYSFDISILEFLAPLISGGSVYIASQELLLDPHLIIKKLQEISPTIMQATPSFYQMLFNIGWHGDKGLKVLCGGDLLSEALADKLINNSLEVWNMYGPTETTIWSSIKKINHSYEASNIGKPINNTKFYILDDFLYPKPIGTPGTIYIAGDGLAKGYYKNNLLTREKFIKNPFDNASLFYETGDIGKWNDSGEIEFLGRNDNQVKIRGYRIELGDIESKINKIEGIKDSIAIAKKGVQQEAFLVVYILKSIDVIDIEKILAALKLELPYYMIPNAIIPLEEFPLTPNQKIDRKSLMQREIQQKISHDDFKAPNSYFEVRLSEYWKEVLNINGTISVNDNFFELGGHSLNAVKLVGLVSKQLSLVITLKSIFDYPTIELLANHLKKLKPIQSLAISSSETKEFYDLTPPQYNIWLASQQRSTSIAYNMSASYKIVGTVNVDKISKSIIKIIRKHEILRTNFIEINGFPYQKIIPFERIGFEISINQSKCANIEETINNMVNTEFDLGRDLLIRVQLLQIEVDQFLLLFTVHHIIMDGLSLEIFIKEFIENYNDSPFQDNPLKFQFKDYSEWSNKMLKDTAFENERFWKKYLCNYKPKDSFERDCNCTNDQGRASKISFELKCDTTLALKKLALEKQVTFHIILAAALNALIYKISNHIDICIGSISSGRNVPEFKDQIGMFVKTIVLRTQIDSQQTFTNLLGSIQNDLLEIDNYQDVPFDKLPQSFFDIILVYQNPEFSFGDINELEDIKLLFYPVDNGYSKMPMVFNFFESENKLKGTIDYNCDLFQEEMIQIIALKYSKLLDEITKESAIKIDLIDTKLDFENTNVIEFDFNF